MRVTRNRITTSIAFVGVAALALTACGNDSGGSDAGSTDSADGGVVNITVATFNEFGYEDLIKEWNTAHPNIQVTQKKAATSDEARENMKTKLAAGSGLSDVEAIEVDWLPELMQYPDKFVDLTADDVKDRWLPWKTAQATTSDGKLLGYGTDIGPEGVCYRSDLFAAAGLPTDRDQVAALLGGDGATWDKYFEVGKQFVTATPGVAWFDSAGATYQGMINQVKNAYEKEDGTIIATDNPDVKKIYDSVLTASTTDGLSAHLSQWSDDWSASFQKGSFATMLCPGWMLGVIEGNAKGVTGWDIANVFPGGGGNWGGSFLTVPAQGKHPKEAQEVADWLTAPEQQIKAFTAKGTFPSQVEALKSPDLLSQTNPFFNNAPVGTILADRANAVSVTPFKGPNYFAVNNEMQNALTRVDVDKTDDAATSWDKFVTAVKALG